MHKIIEKGLCIISCLFLLWLFVSWAEVVSKNLTPNPTYNEWNAFVLITKGDRQGGYKRSYKATSKGQGSYGRLDARLDELQAEDPDKYDEVMQELDAQNFKDIVDLAMYLEG